MAQKILAWDRDEAVGNWHTHVYNMLAYSCLFRLEHCTYIYEQRECEQGCNYLYQLRMCLYVSVKYSERIKCLEGFVDAIKGSVCVGVCPNTWWVGWGIREGNLNVRERESVGGESTVSLCVSVKRLKLQSLLSVSRATC